MVIRFVLPIFVYDRCKCDWYTVSMQLYTPPTKIEGRLRDVVVILIGLWLSILGIFAWWTDYVLYSMPQYADEWTSEEKEQSLTRLIERAKKEGVVELSSEEKLRLMQ